MSTILEYHVLNPALCA